MKIVYFVLTRFAKAILTIYLVVSAVFFIVEVLPGDPAELIAGELAGKEQIEAVRKKLGLDLPLYERYKNIIFSSLKFEFGKSFWTEQNVSEIIAERIKNTFILGSCSLLLSLVGGVILALVYFRFKKFDEFIVSITTAIYSIPNFWLGVILIIIFSVKLKLFPVSGFSTGSTAEALKHLFLPSITLSLSLSVVLSRFIKNLVEEVIKTDFFLLVKAKGVSKTREILHIAKAISPGIITVIGLQAGVLLSGTVVTETVFSFPGIGLLMVEAVMSRDFPTIMGCIFTTSSIWVIVNTLVDFIILIIDPRLRK